MKKILFIDDDQFLTTLYRTRLSSEGYLVDVANSGSEALEKLNHFIPELIVLDLNMPGINGVDVLKQLRARPSLACTAVIIFSYGYVQNLIDEATRLGVIRVLTKSNCPPNKMMAEIRDVMNSLPDQSAKSLSGEGVEEKKPMLSSLDALNAAAELTWQTIDLFTLPEDASHELRRKALAGLFRNVRQRLKECLLDQPESPREALSNVLIKLFEEFYAHPEMMTKPAIQNLLKGLGNLSRMPASPRNYPKTAMDTVTDFLNSINDKERNP